MLHFLCPPIKRPQCAGEDATCPQGSDAPQMSACSKKQFHPKGGRKLVKLAQGSRRALCEGHSVTFRALWMRKGHCGGHPRKGTWVQAASRRRSQRIGGDGAGRRGGTDEYERTRQLALPLSQRDTVRPP